MLDRQLYLEIFNNDFNTKKSMNDIDKISFIDDILSNIIVKEDKKKYPNSVFFFYGDTIYFELETQNRYLYCSYRHIWSIFERVFGMEYNDIQAFIKGTVEQHFNSGPITPSFRRGNRYTVEEHFNSGPITPCYDTHLIQGWNNISIVAL